MMRQYKFQNDLIFVIKKEVWVYPGASHVIEATQKLTKWNSINNGQFLRAVNNVSDWVLTNAKEVKSEG